MAILEVKIHPAIGIARMGNSPTDFFIGPERRWDHAPPSGGYKDSQCRIKRQAARFRLFAYHDVGPPTEITAADGEITWTVHLVNSKATAAGNNAPAANLTIDPGARTLDGPDQVAKFDTGTITLPAAPTTTVPLGEIRTDDHGRLLVLGGFGHSGSPLNLPVNSSANNPGWYDDTSDGPVTATVTIGADTFIATAAWVAIAPPKFAPSIDNVVTLWDKLFDQFVAVGSLTAPATPSYTNDIFPILQAANDAAAVRQTAAGHHGFVHPVTNAPQRATIYNKLKAAGGNMPPIQNLALTSTQHDLMELWKDGTFTNDWVGPPTPPATITPDGLDRAALEHAVGGSFGPGVEVDLSVGILSQFVAPFRLVESASMPPGKFTRGLVMPWQADFHACGDDWWPVPRPNQVIRAGAYAEWKLPGVASHLDMVNKWHTLGFVVRQGLDLVEVDRCDLANAVVNLVTPALTFTDIAQGPMGTSRTVSRAAVFEVTSPVPISLDVTSGPTDPSLTVVSVDPLSAGPSVGGEVLDARVKVSYTAPNDTHSVLDSITVTCVETAQTWVIPIAANAVPRKVAAVALVLDKSGSMNEDRGDGLGTKNQSLRQAAQVFVDVMLEGDKVSLVAFNQDAVPIEPLTVLGDPTDPTDPGRVAIAAAVAGPGLDAGGSTSIGDGIHVGRLSLAGAATDVSTLVVLTDGKQNQPLWIADVAADIDERTYAIGLGTAANTSVTELQSVAGNNGGYLLVTGPISGANTFVLQKYFLQVLCGISNAQVVLDPSGVLVPGQEQRIPFSLTEADHAVDVILLTDAPADTRFRLQTPNGDVIDPTTANQLTGIDFVTGADVAYYRLTLPIELRTGRPEHEGTWHAVVEHRADGDDDRDRDGEWRERRRPFSVIVHAWSDLALTASVRQTGLEPGATAVITASLTDGELPVSSAAMWAEMTSPTGETTRVRLAPAGSVWEGTVIMGQPGTYALRVRGSGTSRKGATFQRERTLTASVWHGGTAEPVRRSTDDETAAFVRCVVGRLASSDRLVALLRRHDVDVNALLECAPWTREPED